LRGNREYSGGNKQKGKRDNAMAWTTPTLVEICVGLEINGYLPAEF
jgi:coenzyme PQQ precursor peptide PqqA